MMQCGSVKKPKKIYIQINRLVEKILTTKVQLKPETFILGLKNSQKKSNGNLVFYMTTMDIYVQKWKSSTIEE